MSATPSNLVAEKRLLRERVLALRDALSETEMGRRSRLVTARLLELEAVRRAQTIFCYLSCKNEVETHQLVRDWLAAGKRIQVPAYDAQQRRYQPSPVDDFDRDLLAGKLGILEPRKRMAIAGPSDIAIVPGVAFDARGHRLGYGKGFYDDMLKHFQGPKIALAFDCQMLPEVPQGEGDVAMDAVVAESAVYWRELA